MTVIARAHAHRVVLFDLDGTLVDPFVGITSCYQHALEALGHEVPEAESLAGCIGPPIRRNFERLLRTSDRTMVERGVAIYRERYGALGWRQNQVYPGVPEMLEALRRAGMRLFVATAKAEPFASRVVAHHGLDACLDGVFGPDLDGHLDDKGRLVARIVGVTAADPAGTVLVGDREHDMRAAWENGLRGIGATWGYGSRDELSWAGAHTICASPAEVTRVLLGAPA